MTTDLFDRLRAVWSYLEGEAMDGSEAHRRMADAVEETGETLEALLEKAERLSQQLSDARAVVGPVWFPTAETSLAEAIRAKAAFLEEAANAATDEATRRLEHERTKRDFLERELDAYREKAERLSQQFRDARAVVGPEWFVSAETSLAEAIRAKAAFLEETANAATDEATRFRGLYAGGKGALRAAIADLGATSDLLHKLVRHIDDASHSDLVEADMAAARALLGMPEVNRG